MVTLVIEGQSLELPETVAINDDALRKAIAPLFPQVATARFERVTNPEGQTVIKILKEAGTKGLGSTTSEDIVAALKQCPRHINPALELHQRLTRIDPNLSYEQTFALQHELDQAITAGERELELTNAILTQLHNTPATAAVTLPIGF
jgi:hypothetical protein